MRRLEICEFFGFSSRTFDRLRAEGRIPAPTHIVGDTRYWDREVVEDLFRVDKDVPSKRRDHRKARGKAKAPTAQ
jgi:hypothetical protein